MTAVFRTLDLPPVFREVLLNLDLESTVSLYLACTEEMREKHFVGSLYPELLRRHLRVPFPVGVTGRFQDVDFVSYVKFVRTHGHSVLTRKDFFSERRYLTHAFSEVPMLPPRQAIRVLACLFLPREAAAGIFSDNLVVLDDDGVVRMFSPGESCYRRTARKTCDGLPFQLACSPAGNYVLAVGCGGTTVIRMRSRGGKPSCFFSSSARWSQYGYLRDCFRQEDEFLNVGRDGTVRLHAIFKSRLHTSIFCNLAVSWIADGRLKVQSRWPFNDSPVTGFGFLCHKRAYNDDVECLIVGEVVPRRGLGNALRLVYHPADLRKRREFYLQLEDAVIASAVMHPSHERLMVVVVTRLRRAGDFFDPARAPEFRERVHADRRWPRFEDVYLSGNAAVYEVSFPSDGPSIRPRFYLPCKDVRPSMEGGVSLYSAHSGPMRIDAYCCQITLYVKLDCRLVAQLSLIASEDSEVPYLRISNHGQFAFSCEETYAAFFKYTPSFWSELMTGHRAFDPLYHRLLRGLEYT